mmetsp:Transcript_36858/g.89312  ORF Transcript_36858/g.89312 Transcript_36858/m.89312 type:complete len:648 (+) Transcript_36858:4705-6648(+)
MAQYLPRQAINVVDSIETLLALQVEYTTPVDMAAVENGMSLKKKTKQKPTMLTMMEVGEETKMLVKEATTKNFLTVMMETRITTRMKTMKTTKTTKPMTASEALLRLFISTITVTVCVNHMTTQVVAWVPPSSPKSSTFSCLNDSGCRSNRHLNPISSFSTRISLWPPLQRFTTRLSLAGTATISQEEQELTTTRSSCTALPSWEELEALLLQQEKETIKGEEMPTKPPLVTLFRDTNGWCPFCERVWLALEVKGIPYQEQLINLQNKPEWFKLMVPTTLVPAVLIHTDQMDLKISSSNTNNGADKDLPPIAPSSSTPVRTLVWESLDIMKALDEQFPHTQRLVIDDQDDYIHARNIASKATTAGVKLLYGSRNNNDTASMSTEEKEKERTEKRVDFLSALKDFDLFLGKTQSKNDGPYCLGADITGVDIEMIPTMERWRYQLPLTANITIYDEAQFPNIVRWFDALDQYEPYYNRVAGDAYSWTAVASTFLRYFATGPNGTMSVQTQQTIDIVDAAANKLMDSFATSTLYEETPSARQQAASKILSNHQAIVADSTNSDPQSQKETPRATDVDAAIAILRAVVTKLIKDVHDDGDDIVVDPSVDATEAALAARTVASRLCVPRDMGAPAAQVLRKSLIQAADAFTR